MVNVKISLITVSYNAENTIQRCIASVAQQSYPNIEYIVVDGNSSDNTSQIIRDNLDHVRLFISEEDEGIYDAVNKGISRCTGEVIGLLHADDFLSNADVINDIAQCFMQDEPDLLYADLDYINPYGKIIRRWRSGPFRPHKFNWGWMPPHPTFYAKKRLYDRLGLYNPDYGTAADYELMLRFMYVNQPKVSYLKKVIVKMVSGGASNKSFNNRILAWKNDYRAMKYHQLNIPILGLVLKPLRKIAQYRIVHDGFAFILLYFSK